ncbi:hypothetical protein chiPu_0012196 [Chiloscyllium punctatum]|uniref:Uncharacterized protein n=1 Tax=Chiloscyllium punctatum TaxID=137246 RepID=A0A401STN0_CHIPU|nr:hypothetical protein [Chiloscyllium punctatum]
MGPGAVWGGRAGVPGARERCGAGRRAWGPGAVWGRPVCLGPGSGVGQASVPGAWGALWAGWCLWAAGSGSLK